MNLAGRRTKWLVLVLWLVIFGAAGTLGGKLQSVTKDTAAAYLPGSAEATQVVKLQDKVSKDDSTLAVISYERRSGITAADRKRAQADALNIAKVHNAEQPVGPLTSKDGQAMQILVPVKGEGTTLVNSVTDVRNVVNKAPPAGLDVRVTGPAGSLTDLVKVYSAIDGTLLLVTVAVVIAVLLLTYRSPFLWFVPFLSAIMGFVLAEGVVYLLAKAGLTVNSQSAAVLAILVFGVGTDYALLIIARYREELHRYEDKHEAMRKALHRAGPAILASGSTVTIGLLCMLFAELNSTSGLGPVAAAGVISALLAMTTFLPALLTALPRGVFWPVVPRYSATAASVESEHGIWTRLAGLVGSRSRLIWIGAALVLCVATLGLMSLKIGPVSNSGQYTGTRPDSVVGEQALARHFPAGTGSPAVIIGKSDAASAIKQVVARTPGVATVQPPTSGGGYVEYQATLANPPDSSAAAATVDRLRAAVHGVGDAKVGGTTAISLDTERAARHDNKVIIPIVLGMVFLILIVLLRAIIAPLLLMATVVLSFGATMGVCGVVFTHVFKFEGADSSFPLEAFIFLVALGVDYNIFLMSRVREETARLGTRPGILRGLAVTGGVITSAGVVLAATFAALGTLPTTGTAELAFAVAFGVLLDTLLVRSFLVPALAYDIGSKIWWPGSLAKRRSPGKEDRKVRTAA